MFKTPIILLISTILMAFTPNKAWDKVETPPDRYTHGLYSAKTLHTHAVNAFCAEKLGREAPYNQKYLGCYVPREDLIILPMNPPQELIEHEEAHARGWRHK